MTSASGCHPIALFKLWTMWALTGSAQPFPRAMPSSRSLKLQGRMRFTSHPIIFTFSWNQQKGFRIGEITVLIGFKGKCQKKQIQNITIIYNLYYLIGSCSVIKRLWDVIQKDLAPPRARVKHGLLGKRRHFLLLIYQVTTWMKGAAF